jgi:hypothetical protein
MMRKNEKERKEKKRINIHFELSLVYIAIKSKINYHSWKNTLQAFSGCQGFKITSIEAVIQCVPGLPQWIRHSHSSIVK